MRSLFLSSLGLSALACALAACGSSADATGETADGGGGASSSSGAAPGADGGGGSPDAEADADPSTDGGGGGGGGRDGGVAVGAWPDSRTTWCASFTSRNRLCPATCPLPGERGYGQDSNYFPSSAPIYVRTGSTVKDTVTGLTWEDPPSKSHIYANAQSYCATLTLDGVTGFRLPTRLELVSIQDYGRRRATPSPEFDQNGRWLSSWTSVAYAPDPVRAWVVGSNGIPFGHPRGNMATGVRCVSGPVLGGALVAAVDTVKDSLTGLTWQRAEASASATWEEALSTCEALTLDGASTWRLPTVKELLTIVDDTRTAPAIDVGMFRNATAGAVWTSTPVAPQNAVQDFCSYAHQIDFSTGVRTYGDMGMGSIPSPDRAAVRCVR